MADRSGGTVSIRLAVRDGEVVRRALRDIGTEGQVALKALDDATRAPSRSALALSDAIGEVRTSVTGLAQAGGALGPGLTLLRGLGPAGIAAGVGIVAGGAAIAAGFGQAKVAIEEFSNIVDAANSVGLSTDTYQGIAAGALAAGVKTEQLNGALEKFTVLSGQAAAGQGELYEKLAQYNPAAAEAIGNATTQEERVRILARALADASSAEERAALSVAAFGRAGLNVGRAFAEAGGEIERMVERARGLGLLVPQEVLTRTEELGDRLDEASTVIKTQLLIVAADLVPMIAKSAEWARDFALYLGDAYAEFKKFAGSPVEIPITAADQTASALRDVRGRLEDAEKDGNAAVAAQLRSQVAELERGLEAEREAQREANRGRGFNRKPVEAERTATPRTPSSPPSRDRPKTAADLAAEREAARIRADLGDVTALVAIRERELNELVKSGGLTREQATASLAKYRAELIKAAGADEERRKAEATRKSEEADRKAHAATRDRLQMEQEAARVRAGLGDVSGLVAIRERELGELVAKNGLTQAEAAASLAKYRVEVEETAKAEAARSSVFRGLSQLQAQGSDLRGLYDEGAVDVINDMTDGLMKLSESGGKVGDTFKSMAETIRQAVLRMFIARGIAGPMAQGMEQLGDRIFGKPASAAPAVSPASASPMAVTRAPLPAPADAASAVSAVRATAFAPTGALPALRTSGSPNLARVDPVFRDRYAGMMAAAPEDVRAGVSVFSAYRSPEHQARLYAANVAKNGGRPDGYVAPPGRSMHGFGEAMDLRFATPKARAWVHENARGHGLHFPMNDPRKSPYEPWHIEPVGGRRQGKTLSGPGDMPAEFTAASSEVSAFAAKTSEATAGLDGFGGGLKDAAAKVFDSSQGVSGSAEAIAKSAGGVSSSTEQLAQTTAAVPAQAQGFFQSLLGGLGSGLDGIFSMFSGAGGGAGAGGGLLSALSSVFQFADGGVMTSMGKVSRYAAGGVAYGRTFSEFGEGAKPEAYVPLADGRTIPVTVKAPGPRITDEMRHAMHVAEIMKPGPRMPSLMAPPPRFDLMTQEAARLERERNRPSAVAAPLTVNVVNKNGSKVTTKESDDGRGGRRLDVILDQKNRDMLMRPGSQTSRALREGYGVDPIIRKR